MPSAGNIIPTESMQLWSSPAAARIFTSILADFAFPGSVNTATDPLEADSNAAAAFGTDD